MAAESIRLRLFGSLAQLAGWQILEWPWPEQEVAPTPEQIWFGLGLSVALDDLRIAVNLEFASLNQPLRPGDELAFLPPLSGG
jgi:molybdopterin converting factor small subunit